MKTSRGTARVEHTLITSEHPEGEKLPEAYATTIEEIARRAHAIYLSRLCAPGHAIDDWLQAEREIASEGKPIDMPPS
jgi:hypothetical protein